MFCAKCGNKMGDGDKFCLKCGTPAEYTMNMLNNNTGNVRSAAPEKPMKQPKTAKAPKAPKAPKEPKAPKAPKKKGKGGIIIAIVIAIIVLIMGIGIAVVFLLGGGDDGEEGGNSRSRRKGKDEAAGETYEADIEYVCNDATEYPTTKMYFRITDEDDGDYVNEISVESLKINDEEVEIDGIGVDKANTVCIVVDNTNGSSKDLQSELADEVSGTMNGSRGDKMEVIAAAKGNRQMAVFTSDAGNVENALTTMFKQSDLAVYDGIYKAITNVSLKSGAKGVIAVTFAADSASSQSLDSVISYAQKLDVPVYVIDISGTESEDYQKLAEETKGIYYTPEDVSEAAVSFREAMSDIDNLWEITCEAGFTGKADIELKIGGDDAVYEGKVVTDDIDVTKTEVYVPGSHYKFFKANISWAEAEKECEKLGGHLATITSQEEFNEVLGIVQAGGVKGTWIGGFTETVDGKLQTYWVTGEPYSFSKYATGEPSGKDVGDGTPENCLMIWNIEKLGGWTWNDQRNDLTGAGLYVDDLGYVCEWDD